MERRTQAAGRGFVTVKETLTSEVMEISMSGEAGTFFAVGATARALRVAPVWEKTLFNPSFSQALSKTLTNSPHFDFFSRI